MKNNRSGSCDICIFSKVGSGLLTICVILLVSSILLAPLTRCEEIPIVANILNAEPEILEIEVKPADVPGEWIDPGSDFVIRIEIRDNNTLQDIRSLDLILFAPSSFEGDENHEEDHYEFSWDIDNGFLNSGGIGELIEQQCEIPQEISSGIGNWTISAKLEKSALYSSGWTVVCYARDEEYSQRYEARFPVSKYGSLFLDSSNLTFSGQPGSLTSADQNPIDLRYTLNFAAKIRCWSTDFVGTERQDMILNPSSFRIDDDANPSGEDQGIPLLTLDYQRQIFMEELNAEKDYEIQIYLFIEIPDPFYDQDYAGSIFFDLGS